jgi:predicted HicB family RNase H-like nuclease
MTEAMNTIQYKGYEASVVYESGDDLLVGCILHIQDMISFHGISIAEIKVSFQESIDDYLAYCEKVGKQLRQIFV